MMGYGSYGHGVSSSSSSNLSALAPPFTVDRSVSKPILNPLVDLSDSPYGVSLNSSLHNWLPSHYPNSRTGFFSDQSSEFDPLPSSDGFRYPGFEDIKSPNTQFPPGNPIAPAPADAFLYGQCSDGVERSLLEANTYYPTYVPPATQDPSPSVDPDGTSYDWFSSSHVPALDGSSHNDYAQSSSDYTALWGESWSRFGDWEHGKQVELDGSFCSKVSSVAGSSIYKNYMNQGISTFYLKMYILVFVFSVPMHVSYCSCGCYRVSLLVSLWFKVIGQFILMEIFVILLNSYFAQFSQFY